MSKAILHPIGVVHSPISQPRDMPRDGVAASIEVFPPFPAGLRGIEANSHIIVMGWFHQASRNLLEVDYPDEAPHLGPRGVFACRSPARPNPIGLTTVRLLRREENHLYVALLDMINGTPVIDIKPYSPRNDGVFSARSAHDLTPALNPDPAYELRLMLYEGENFHGERCPRLALGVRAVYQMRVVFGVASKDPGVTVLLSDDGCLADTLQALTGATLGNHRLQVKGGASFAFRYHHHELTFSPKLPVPPSVDTVMSEDIKALFDIKDEIIKD